MHLETDLAAKSLQLLLLAVKLVDWYLASASDLARSKSRFNVKLLSLSALLHSCDDEQVSMI